MGEKETCVVIAILVSIICNKILAIYTFRKIDGYVKGVIEITKKSIRDTYHNK